MTKTQKSTTKTQSKKPSMPSKKTTSKPTQSVKAMKTFQRPTHEEISVRAYFISQSAEAGSPEQNWYRAEAELTKTLQ